MRRERKRDCRDYDTTQLRFGSHGISCSRDYSAHFFRWSFAKRFMSQDCDILDIGCGQETPLLRIATAGAARLCRSYCGCDLNQLKPTTSAGVSLRGKFNFVERHSEIQADYPDGFGLIVHFEVFEHMMPDLGRKLLANCKQLLKANGKMIMSTPCYDQVNHAANHIHEYEVSELQEVLNQSGFTVSRRYGTFMNVKEIGKDHGRFDSDPPAHMQEPISELARSLSSYYSNDTLSCFFAPIYPDRSRNCIWICEHMANS